MSDLPHDLWTADRVAAFAAMTAAQRSREFDARIARGDELAPRSTFSPDAPTVDEARKLFVSGERDFDVFAWGAPIFPLLTNAAAAAAFPTAGGGLRPTAAPAIPAATPPPPPAPVIPAAPASKTLTSHEVYEARRVAVAEAQARPAARADRHPARTGADLSRQTSDVYADRAARVREAKQ